MPSKSSAHVHRRRNPLTGEWVLVSPHRAERPWQGKVEDAPANDRPPYDPDCYLCPGNSRANGQHNPDYTDTFVFTNDFSALRLDTPPHSFEGIGTVSEEGEGRAGGSTDELFAAETEQGICRVLCFSPRHDLTLPEMDVGTIGRVVDLWTEEYAQLGDRSEINYVQIFENKGQMMGCSNPHPHGQIWAQRTVPTLPAKETSQQEHYLAQHGETLLAAYLRRERKLQERIVCENAHFAALVPFWAVWPFETMIISRRPAGHLLEMHQEEYEALAEIIKRLTVRYDNLFETSFPYSAGLHQAPTDGGNHPAWHFHMHFYPPLLRSATVKKFMVGYEMLGMPQRDLTAEQSARRLRALPERHYQHATG